MKNLMKLTNEGSQLQFTSWVLTSWTNHPSQVMTAERGKRPNDQTGWCSWVCLALFLSCSQVCRTDYISFSHIRKKGLTPWTSINKHNDKLEPSSPPSLMHNKVLLLWAHTDLILQLLGKTNRGSTRELSSCGHQMNSLDSIHMLHESYY